MKLSVSQVRLGVALATVAILWVCVVVAEGEESTSVAQPKFDLTNCKKTAARIAKRVLKAFGKCSKEIKTNLTNSGAPKDEMERMMGCVVRCTLFKIDMLDAEGHVTNSSSQKFLDKYIPQEAHEFAMLITADCTAEFGAKLDMSEKYCESYNNYVKCLQSAVSDWMEAANCQPSQGGAH